MRKIIILIALLGFSSQLFAYCDGGYPNVTVADEIKKTNFIAIGKATSRKIVVDPIEDPEGYEAELFQVEIEKVLYGNPSGYVVKGYLTLYNANTSSRFNMDIGESYLMFVSDYLDGFFINSCGNSGTVTESKEIIKTIQKIVGDKHA